MDSRDTARASRFAVMLCIFASGCGGGQALMHPAHALPQAAVSAGAGVGGTFVLGDADAAIEAARVQAIQAGSTPEREQAVAAGGMADASLAPGVSPWMGARVGLGWNADGGLTYTGRAARLDGRRAWDFGPYALSAGLGATGILMRPGGDSPDQTNVTENSGGIRGLDSGSMTGWGVDAPILFGWRSDADVVRIWVGVRAGYERIGGEFVLDSSSAPAEPPVGQPLPESESVRVQRWYGGALVGLGVGVGPIWVAVELDGTYHDLRGSLGEGTDEITAELDAFSLTPTGALLTHF